MTLLLVCGECRQRSADCDCPASVQRATPIRAATQGITMARVAQVQHEREQWAEGAR